MVLPVFSPSTRIEMAIHSIFNARTLAFLVLASMNAATLFLLYEPRSLGPRLGRMQYLEHRRRTKLKAACRLLARASKASSARG